jgi:hypothetical protein
MPSGGIKNLHAKFFSHARHAKLSIMINHIVGRIDLVENCSYTYKIDGADEMFDNPKSFFHMS